MSTPATPRDARTLLVEWANEQDRWVRAIVAEALLSRRELSTAAIDSVTDAFLVEKQLAEGDQIDVPSLGDSGADDAESQSLRLVSLRDCRGVNALSEGQAIDFNPRLTILFGENATGKTGYARVLKRVANVRSAEEIIPDIHRATATSGLQALLTYAVEDEERTLDWKGEVGISPLTRISVFDTPAVALHLDEDLTYVYTPPDLALFRFVHSAIEGVRDALEERKTEKKPRQNPFLTAFQRDSVVFPKIEQLGPSTDLAELQSLGTLSAGEQEETDALKLSIESLSSETTAGGSETLRNRISVLRALVTIGEAVTAYDPNAAAAADQELQQARDAQAASGAAILGGRDLPAEVRPAWDAFVEAGDRYLQASDMGTYPAQDDSCIYCDQPLEPSAISLLQSYREYASGAAATAVQTASGKLTQTQEPLAAENVGMALATLNALLPANGDGDDAPSWVAEGRALADAVTTTREAFAEKSSAPSSLDLSAGFSERVAAALREAETASKDLEGDAASRKASLTEKRDRLAALEARATLSRLLPEIRTFVESSVWASKLETLLRRFQGLLRGLTEVSKRASNEVLNQSFREAFEEECKALRAPTVQLGFPGRRGQAARSKTVSADHALAKVLSEGEQKVVAIADFLAEASFRGGSAPMVFDDPVNSLDHRRLLEIVGRIVELSEEHQVVVFTHNIWFASELLDRFDQHSPGDCSFYQVIERAGTKGFVVGGVHPRIDTQGEIKKRIKKAIDDAKAADDGQRVDIVEKGYDHIRAWCEQVVENDLLANVTRRYQPNVAILNLERVKPDKLTSAIETILPIYRRACRYIPGHSQPIATLGVRPTVEQLETDWNDLQEARKCYLGGPSA